MKEVLLKMSDIVVVSMKVNCRAADNIDTFVSYLKNNAWFYDKTGNYCGLAKKHFTSISSEMEVNENRTINSDGASSLLSFACIWSMHNMTSYAETSEQKNKTTLEECCKELSLEIEAFAEGNDFDEYFRCSPKEGTDGFDILLGTENVDEIYSEDLDDPDFPERLKEINSRYDTAYTREDIISMCADEDYCRIGGYDWEFTI